MLANKNRFIKITISLGAMFSLCFLSSCVSTPKEPVTRNIETLFSELNALNDENYTGGLSTKNRALAREIRLSLEEEYPVVLCDDPDEDQGELIGYSGDDERFANLSTQSLAPALKSLVGAFNHENQEVRDTAAYTMGLLGPSGKDIAPFLGRRFAQKFEEDPIKGDWHSDAYGKVICEAIGSARFVQVIPDHLLPNQESLSEFLEKSALLMATLYLDEDIEYPPGMMGDAYGNYAIADRAGPAASLFAQILENDRLSTQKHIETIRALSFLTEAEIQPALAGLLSFEDTGNEDLQFQITSILTKLKHPAALPFLVKLIDNDYTLWAWEAELCGFGPQAINVEDALLRTLKDEDDWPTTRRAAVNVLGCIQSVKSIPTLLQALEFPDWETKEVIATALGKVGAKNSIIIDTLKALEQNHWSKRVRKAAYDSLVELDVPNFHPPKKEEIDSLDGEDDDIIIVLGPVPVNHGLPWCDDKGKYSIDGEEWFFVSWIKPFNVDVPLMLSTIPDNRFSAGQYVTVDDGWLFGVDRGHYDGDFQHISTNGDITELDESEGTDIVGFAHVNGKILGFGYQVLKGGDGGSLFEISKNGNGQWTSKRIAALPSPPKAFYLSPNGDLLLSDGPNQYGFINNEIVPLQCEIVFEGDYFAYE